MLFWECDVIWSVLLTQGIGKEYVAFPYLTIIVCSIELQPRVWIGVVAILLILLSNTTNILRILQKQYTSPTGL